MGSYHKSKEAFERGRPRLPADDPHTVHDSTLAMNVKVSNPKRYYFHKGNLSDKITYVCGFLFLFLKKLSLFLTKIYVICK